MTRKELRAMVKAAFERRAAEIGRTLHAHDWTLLDPTIDLVVDGGMAETDAEIDEAVRKLAGEPPVTPGKPS